MDPIVPSNDDVLMGRGGRNNQHVGNERLRDMARAKAAQYKAADKKEKSDISLKLVRQVNANGGRFLKRDPVSMQWHLVAMELSREKASQCLRDAVSKKNGRRTSTSDSSAASSITEGTAAQKTESPVIKTRPPQDNYSYPASAELLVQPQRRAILETQTPVAMDLKATPHPKRKAIYGVPGLEATRDVDPSVAGRKRRRVSEEPGYPLVPTQDDDDATPISIISDAALEDLFANNDETTSSHPSNDSFFDDDLTEPKLVGFDFELFDCDSLLSDESLSDDFQW